MREHEHTTEALATELADSAQGLRGWLGERLGSASTPGGEELDDLVQDVFCAARRALGGLRRRDAAGVRAWLRRIALNRLTDGLRRVRLRGVEGLEAELPAVSSPCVRDVQPPMDSALSECALLDDQQRIAVVLRDCLASEWGTARFVLGRVSEKATRNLHLRARRRMTRPTVVV